MRVGGCPVVVIQWSDNAAQTRVLPDYVWFMLLLLCLITANVSLFPAEARCSKAQSASQETLTCISVWVANGVKVKPIQKG